VKTVEDLADLATDELRGAFENKSGGERARTPGALESFSLSQDDAERIILRARVAAGWIDAADVPELAEPEQEADEISELDEVFNHAPAHDAEPAQPTEDA